MNDIVKSAYEIMEGCFKRQYIPELEVGDEVEINDIWDGTGDVDDLMDNESYSIQLSDMDWINYEFEIINIAENQLDTIVKITTIELL